MPDRSVWARGRQKQLRGTVDGETQHAAHERLLDSRAQGRKRRPAIANPLGGIDQLLHGSTNLRGWGLSAVPDPRLYSVRGFDSLARQFKYEVNPRFGITSPANSSVRAPFRLELAVSLSVGPPMALQQLERWVQVGEVGRSETDR